MFNDTGGIQMLMQLEDFHGIPLCILFKIDETP